MTAETDFRTVCSRIISPSARFLPAWRKSSDCQNEKFHRTVKKKSPHDTHMTEEEGRLNGLAPRLPCSQVCLTISPHPTSPSPSSLARQLHYSLFHLFLSSTALHSGTGLAVFHQVLLKLTLVLSPPKSLRLSFPSTISDFQSLFLCRRC